MARNPLLAVIVAAILSPVASNGESPYIYKVHEYRPAPGQFVNELPKWEAGDDWNDLRLKAEESIEGTTGILVSLGGYGGYIIFSFDHRVKNVKGEYDFKILANAFYANANPNPDAPAEGGSCEPGIVMVSRDTNGNGRPDDEWYELAGSEYNSPVTIHNYQVTYHRPDPDKTPEPQPGYEYINDMTYIPWHDNQGMSGYVARNVFHDQSYWPQWLDSDKLTFTGTKLADNWVDESGNGSYYVLYAYPWGYVDNHPNNDERCGFKIDWAVDGDGNPVELDGIDFIKVYTGVNQYCGWLGETSTEIVGAIDLHIPLSGVENIPTRITPRVAYRDCALLVAGIAAGEPLRITDMSGKVMASFTSTGEGEQNHPINLDPGLYIVTTPGSNHKIIVK